MTSSLLFAGSSTYRLIHDGLDVGWLLETHSYSLAFSRSRRPERAGDAGHVALLDWLDGTSEVADEEKMRIRT